MYQEKILVARDGKLNPLLLQVHVDLGHPPELGVRGEGVGPGLDERQDLGLHLRPSVQVGRDDPRYEEVNKLFFTNQSQE